MTESPYLFRAADHPLLPVTEQLKVREAVKCQGVG